MSNKHLTEMAEIESLAINEDSSSIADPPLENKESLRKNKNAGFKKSIDKVVQPVMDNVITRVEDVSEKVIEATSKLNQLTPKVKKKHLTLEEKQEFYLQAAIEAIQEIGPGCSMENIALKAGVSKPIIYKVFKDRNGLIAAIGSFCEGSITKQINEALTDGSETIHTDPRAVLISAIYTYVCFMEQNQNLYLFLRQNSASSTLSNNFVTIVAKQVSITIDEFLHHFGMDTGPAELWGNSIVGMIGQATEWWIEHKILSRQRMVDYLVSLLWSGFEGIAIDSGVNIYNK